MSDGIQDGLVDITPDNGQARVPSIEAGVLNAVAHSCWQTSDSHGFHEDWEMTQFLDKLGDWLGDSGYQRGEIMADLGLDTEAGRGDVGEYVHQIAAAMRTNIVGMKLMLTVSELGEALESLRNVGADGLLSTEPHDTDDIRAKSRANFAEELADAKIRLDDLAGYLRIAIGDEQIAKMATNETRPHKHGRVV